MCNACGFSCCAYDGFSGCGCDECSNPQCWTKCEGCGFPEEFCECDADDYDDDDDEITCHACGETRDLCTCDPDDFTQPQRECAVCDEPITEGRYCNDCLRRYFTNHEQERQLAMGEE